jgi:hypothetical protein
VTVDGTTKSGAMDTSFGNTFREIMYVRYVCERILKLRKEEYELSVAGDDFELYLHPWHEDHTIRAAFMQVFAGAMQAQPHGLGQLLKFMNISTIQASSFCSTEVFWCDGCQSYKVVRQLPRFLATLSWSHTALSLSAEQKAIYFTSLYESNLHWMKGLPIFSELNDWLNYGATDYKSMSGDTKERLYVPPEERFLEQHDSVLEAMLRRIDPDKYHSTKLQKSEKFDCCVQAFYGVLAERYGLPYSTVVQLQATIKGTSKYERVVLIPELVAAVEYRTNYRFDPNSLV